MRRIACGSALCLIALSGCAIVKTTDVTDASFKRHQSVAVLGWPIYSRVTDKEPGLSASVAGRREYESDQPIRAAEMFEYPDIDRAVLPHEPVRIPDRSSYP